MKVATEEMVSARDFRRESADHLRRLQEGEVEKIVLTRHGDVVGVILAPGKYEALVDHYEGGG